MTDLEDQLRRTLSTVASEGGVSPYPHLSARPTRRWTLPARPTLAVVGVALAVALAVLVVVLPGGHTRPPSLAPTQSVQGTWSALPTSPLAPRSGASQVWTGEQLIVWGGEAVGGQALGDGASYDPSTGAWTKLPDSPLSGRFLQASVWTGTQLIIWGGSDGPRHVLADGAAYTPATRSWSMLPAGPLPARSRAFLLWTGHEVVVIGGSLAVNGGDSQPSAGDGATYDPATGQWQSIRMPYVMPTRPLDWVVAVQGDGALYAWTQWQDGKLQGQDLFTWDESARKWDLIPRNDGLPNVIAALWTGKSLLTRGFPVLCIGCDMPYMPESSKLSDSTLRHWGAVPADPTGGTGLSSAWVRGHLISLMSDGQSGTHGAGSTTAYDPATTSWQALPTSPSGCSDEPPLQFAADKALLYCGDTSGGLAYAFTS